MQRLKLELHRLLRLSEQFTKTDMVYLAKGGFFLTLTQISSAIISLILTIAFANLIPKETYGTYRYMLSIYTLVAILALPGIDTAVTQSVSKGFDYSLIDGFKAKFKFSILGTLASFFFSAYYFVNDNTTLGTIFAIVAIALPFMESPTVLASFFNGKKLFPMWALMDIASQIISASSMITAIFLTKNIFFMVIAYFLPLIVVRMGWYFWAKKKLVKNTDSDNRLFGYGKSLTIFQIMSRATASIDQIVLFHFLGPAQLAIFSLAQAIPNRIQSLLKITGTLAFPKFAERDSKEIAKTLPRKLFLLVPIIILGCVLYVFIAPYLFTYIFPKYYESLLYSQVLVFYTLSAISYPFSSYLLAHKKMKENYILSFTGIAVKIIVLIALVPVIGIWGAIVSILTSSLIVTLLSFYFLKKTSPSVIDVQTKIEQQ